MGLLSRIRLGSKIRKNPSKILKIRAKWKAMPNVTMSEEGTYCFSDDESSNLKTVIGYGVVDGDLMCKAFDPDSELLGTVFYNQREDFHGSITWTAGMTDEYDEEFCIDLANIPCNIASLQFTGILYDAVNRNVSFGNVAQLELRLIDAASEFEIGSVNYRGSGHRGVSSLELGSLQKDENCKWRFISSTGFDDIPINLV